MKLTGNARSMTAARALRQGALIVSAAGATMLMLAGTSSLLHVWPGR